MDQPDRAEPPPRNLPPHALGVLTAALAPLLFAVVVAGLALGSGGCGDNLGEPPEVCQLEGVARARACTKLCKTGDDTAQICPGNHLGAAVLLACVAECEACAPDVAWCPL